MNNICNSGPSLPIYPVNRDNDPTNQKIKKKVTFNISNTQEIGKRPASEPSFSEAQPKKMQRSSASTDSFFQMENSKFTQKDLNFILQKEAPDEFFNFHRAQKKMEFENGGYLDLLCEEFIELDSKK